MTLTCKPVGRGNWAPLKITIEGKHSAVFSHMWGFKVGQTFTLANITWRVCAIEA